MAQSVPQLLGSAMVPVRLVGLSVATSAGRSTPRTFSIGDLVAFSVWASPISVTGSVQPIGALLVGRTDAILTESTSGHAEITASRRMNSVKEPVRIHSFHAESLSALQIPQTTEKKEEPAATNAFGTEIPAMEAVARGIFCVE